ncbi:MAG: ImmA/IrrE family metallo-endopeptidase [Candidatus Fimivivens sp.]|nr:ImmA/IrrE family metallo-endopeptidase [Candidatus Fimivivens sp.]
MRNFLSRKEADELGDALVREYTGNNAESALFVDVDGLVTEFLRCKVLYEAFAEDDMDKIGFSSDGITPLSVCREGKTVQAVFPRNTIVLEKSLLEPSEQFRRRFTLAHEAGHMIAAKLNPEQEAGFQRVYDGERLYTAEELRTRFSIGEWQANTIAAALLMPTFLIKSLLQKYNNGQNILVYGNSVFAPREKSILQKMSDTLGVSYTALVIRLRDLSALDFHPIEEYVVKEFRLGSEIQ